MQPDASLEADAAACRVLLKNGSKTFWAASRLLPRRVRDPATALYAFCRVADDAIDADPNATEATVDVLRARLDRIYAGRPDDSPVDRALAVVVAKDAIPRALPDALLEGLAWDAQGRRYETLDELYAYAARVAGTVGAMMTLVMGGRGAAVLARACDLGVAMQLTNIARDVGEDAGRGRIYLPMAWMREAGMDPGEWLKRPAPSDALATVVARLLATADGLYRRADEGVPALPKDCRTAIFAARLIYSDIGRYIARARFDSVTRRAYVPLMRKLWLLARSVGARWMPRIPSSAPPLEPVRFLVAACETET
jgi:phytoene synthase